MDIGNVYNVVSDLVHPSNHPGDSVFVNRAANGYLDEEDVGLAQQIGGTCQNLKVEALGVDLDDFGRRSARRRDNFIKGHHGNRNSRSTRDLLGERAGNVPIGISRKWQHASLVCSAGIDPRDFAVTIEQVLDVYFQVVLRFDEGVVRFRKIRKDFSRPGTPVGANIYNMLWVIIEPLEYCEEAVYAV